MHTRDWIQRWALYTPHKIAIEEHTSRSLAQRRLSYAELDAAGERLAHWLAGQGIGKGDRVAILAENSLEHFLLFAAALKSGVIIVPMNYRLAAREIAHVLGDAEPAIIFYDEGAATLLQAPDAADAFARVPHQYSLAELWALATNDDKETGNAPVLAPVLAAQLSDDDPVLILYTSGTTGTPKGALYTHGMMLWNAINTILSINLTHNDHSVVFLPLFHTGGFNVLATPLLFVGGSFCLMKSFDAASVLALVESQRMTILMGVPTTLRLLATAPDFATRNLSSLRYAVVGGEPMPIPLIETWHARGVAVRQGFGMTEVGPNLFSLHQDDATRKIGSIGRPNFYVETRIAADVEGDALLLTDAILDFAPNALIDAEGNCSGELLLRGPMTTTGYWRNPDASADALRGGWFHTGDVVRRDAEGYFFVIDRKKNMFISGGENVFPAEVEKFLLTHDGIAEAAVVGVPDERWGEAGAAFVVLAARGEALTANDVLAYCAGKLAKYKIPKHVRFVAELPKNDAGKINRRALQQGFMQG
jgi:fatty-acyl-CoA synthase